MAVKTETPAKESSSLSNASPPPLQSALPNPTRSSTRKRKSAAFSTKDESDDDDDQKVVSDEDDSFQPETNGKAGKAGKRGAGAHHASIYLEDGKMIDPVVMMRLQDYLDEYEAEDDENLVRFRKESDDGKKIKYVRRKMEDGKADKTDDVFCIDENVLRSYFYWAHERDLIRRRRWVAQKTGSGAKIFTNDPVLRTSKYSGVYRYLDRGCQFLLHEVICTSELEPKENYRSYPVPLMAPIEVIFRVLFWHSFCSVTTWKLFCESRGGMAPTWGAHKGEENGGWVAEAYDPVKAEEFLLDTALKAKEEREEAKARGETIPKLVLFTGGFILKPGPYGATDLQCDLRNTCRQIYYWFTEPMSLPQRLLEIENWRAAYETFMSIPGLGAFLSGQRLLELSYTGLFKHSANKWKYPGRGAQECLKMLFGKDIEPYYPEAIRWIFTNQGAIFRRYGLEPPSPFEGVEGMSMEDIEHGLCEAFRYMREVSNNKNKKVAHVELPPAKFDTNSASNSSAPPLTLSPALSPSAEADVKTESKAPTPPPSALLDANIKSEPIIAEAVAESKTQELDADVEMENADIIADVIEKGKAKGTIRKELMQTFRQDLTQDLPPALNRLREKSKGKKAEIVGYFTDPFPPVPPTYDEDKDFEVSKILACTWTIFNKSKTSKAKRQFFVRWDGFGPEEDSWIDESALENSKELVNEWDERDEKIRELIERLKKEGGPLDRKGRWGALSTDKGARKASQRGNVGEKKVAAKKAGKSQSRKGTKRAKVELKDEEGDAAEDKEE